MATEGLAEVVQLLLQLQRRADAVAKLLFDALPEGLKSAEKEWNWPHPNPNHNLNPNPNWKEWNWSPAEDLHSAMKCGVSPVNALSSTLRHCPFLP